ncbi:metallophosphoesterase family protein [Fulvivirgaceae bacterium BMA10]|uniref:Phosphoesterase n=1 Tax=Splendidivirga corallicola TaxID=3051826 RepID=A0ABT8KP76_9BACT|nr:metallophosphoesterase family protein [Fulvivirgaceae bacterium BMA10]
MKIGLISDTHGYLDEKVFKHFESCDEIWHAGDIGTVELADRLEAFKPFKAVYGNIDGQSLRIRYPEHLRFNCNGLNVWMTHIGGYPPKYNKFVKPELQNDTPDIFICGHSHILRIMTDPMLNKLLYLNPGAAGIQGFHKVKTLIRFDINEGNVQNMQVIELGKRG